MKLTKILSNIVFATMLLVSLFSYQALAQQKETTKKYVKIDVDGLACPFCAYGLEKKLLQIDGADNFNVDIDSAYATLTFPITSKVTKNEIKQIVKDAGFSARDILFSDKPFKN